MNIETERKFLIKLPDLNFIKSIDGCIVREIWQTYLRKIPGSPKTERRVRKITENGKMSYVFTLKMPRDRLSRFEEEREISSEEYANFLTEADLEVAKTRYAFPYGGHVMEIDVYPREFGGELFDGYAILEVELSSPDEPIAFPDFLEIVREVTDDRAYHNKTIAHRVRVV